VGDGGRGGADRWRRPRSGRPGSLSIDSGSLDGIAVISGGVALIGVEVAMLIYSDSVGGMALIGLGVALIGGGVVLIDSDSLGRIAIIGLGIAFIGIGVSAIGLGVVLIGAGARRRLLAWSTR
jgi:hypothetical protein